MKAPQFKLLPLEIGKRYQTKFATGDFVTLHDIVYHEQKVDGKMVRRVVGLKVVYEGKEHLGVCPLGADRLIQEREKIGEVEICSHCGEILE